MLLPHFSFLFFPFVSFVRRNESKLHCVCLWVNAITSVLLHILVFGLFYKLQTFSEFGDWTLNMTSSNKAYSNWNPIFHHLLCKSDDISIQFFFLRLFFRSKLWLRALFPFHYEWDGDHSKFLKWNKKKKMKRNNQNPFAVSRQHIWNFSFK